MFSVAFYLENLCCFCRCEAKQKKTIFCEVFKEEISGKFCDNLGFLLLMVRILELETCIDEGHTKQVNSFYESYSQSKLFLLQVFNEYPTFVISSHNFYRDILTMSTAFLTAIAVILCILFRLLNVNSQPLKPVLWCIDETFLDCIFKIAPVLREP